MASKITTINTSSATGNFPSANGQGFSGNSRTLAFQGTFASGTIKISASYDGGTNFITLTDADGSDISITSDSIVNISLGTGVKIRYDVSGVSGTMAVDVFMA
tara:strand:+ start:89 stop:397 length:309 start_codon:yes stop_codon:yes gene_type:complete